MDTGNREYLPNPRDSAGVISVVFYLWMIPLFRKGYYKILELSDVYLPRRADRSITLGQRLEQSYENERKKAKPSLLRAIAKTFWKEFSITGFMYVVNDGSRLIQPLLLGKLLIYFRDDSPMSYNEAAMYAGLMVTMAGIGALINSHYYFIEVCNSTKVRAAICKLIYKKSMRLSQSSLHDTSPGKLVNLLSNDVSRFQAVSSTMNALWVSPLITVIAMVLLWREIQWAGIFGSIIFFAMMPLQSWFGRLSMQYGRQTAMRTDERIRFMDEIISGVQVIKMYAWERPFAQLITFARQLELRVILKNMYIKAIYMSFILFTTRIALFCAIVSSILLYGQESITISKVFQVAAYFNVLSYALTEVFLRAIGDVAAAAVSIKRLENFLNYEEKVQIESIIDEIELKERKITTQFEDLDQQKAIVSIRNASANWIPFVKRVKTKKNKKVPDEENPILDARPPTLQNINMEIMRGKLIGIIGPVGAGKSSLLQVLLRELPLESGSISINGTLAYASQEPWIFAGSVRQNILFGQEMNRKRYDAVVKTCALVKDFASFEKGDLTMIGERGAALSGGQKARLNLARAVYRKADVYLLDDPLSAVDAHVGLHLFNECLGPKGQLARQRATRILVTHQVHFLKEADWVVIMRDGKIEAQGTNSDIQKSGIDFSSLLASSDDDNNIDSETSSPNRSRSNSEAGSRRGSVFGKIKDEEKPLAEEQTEEMHALEDSSKGKIKGTLLFHYLKSAQKPIMLSLILLLFVISQILASGADYWVAYWTRMEEQRTQFMRQMSTINTTSSNNTSEASIPDAKMPLLSTETCTYIQGGLLLTLIVAVMTRSISYYRLCLTASQKLHDSMFNGLISTTMRFFDTNPSGRILNRFSKDMGETDEFLSKVLLDALQLNLIAFGAIGITLIVNPVYIVPLLFIALIAIFLRKIYMKSSRNLKRLEGMAKSPIFSQIAASIGGLATIRAFNAEDILLAEFDKHQDLHTSCWVTYIAAGSTFAFILDIMVFIFTACVISSFLLLDTGVTADKVGLAITQSLVLISQFKWAVIQTSEVQNHLMALERILDYRELKPEEEPEQPLEVPPEWPSNGQIEFRQVFYKYFIESEPVLRGLTFTIRPQEKIGIVGRTGAGKSSVIGALFRLALVEGEIFIDDINTSKLRLKDLRSKIAIIPQDPVLFSGTLRRNLDPFEEYNDDDIWKSLEDVKLKDLTAGPNGLQMPVMSHGSNFSVGQRQLLCLARAILRKNRILVMDEATANVDPLTDTLIQQTIREKFAKCTVLTIAHRLHTIIDMDRVLVMDAGRAVEFDTAQSLLQNESGIFKSMVEALGAQESDRLKVLTGAY